MIWIVKNNLVKCHTLVFFKSKIEKEREVDKIWADKITNNNNKNLTNAVLVIV